MPGNNDMHVVFMADVVGSTRMNEARRKDLQVELTNLIDRLNRSFRQRLRTPLLITAGDSFQAVLADPATIPDIAWEIWLSMRKTDIRIGIGFGRIYTVFSDDSRLMDGPAFHNAADAASDDYGISFRGFGAFEDVVLTGIGSLLNSLFRHFTDRQRVVLNLLRHGKMQWGVATELGVSKQAVSAHVRLSGWRAYQQGEAAMREALVAFTEDRSSGWAL